MDCVQGSILPLKQCVGRALAIMQVYSSTSIYTQSKQGKAEVVVCVDTVTSARGNEHRVVVRDIQRLKVTTAFGVHKHSQLFLCPA